MAELEAEFFSKVMLYGAKSVLFGIVKQGQIDISHYEDILRIASKYSIEETVKLAKEEHPNSYTNNRRDSNRLDVAKDGVAKARGIEKKAVNRAVGIARRLNGVDQRRNMLAGQRRKAKKIAASGNEAKCDVLEDPSASDPVAASAIKQKVDFRSRFGSSTGRGEGETATETRSRVAGSIGSYTTPPRPKGERGGCRRGSRNSDGHQNISNPCNRRPPTIQVSSTTSSPS